MPNHHLPRSKQVGGFSCQLQTSDPPPVPSLVSSDDGQPRLSRPPPPSLSLKANTPAHTKCTSRTPPPLKHFMYLSRISRIPPPPLEHLTYLLNTPISFPHLSNTSRTSRTPHAPLHTSRIPPNTSTLPLKHRPPYVIIDIYVEYNRYFAV